MIALHPKLEKLTRWLLGLLTVFFVVMGVATTFTLAPFQVPDESAHWASAVFRAKNFLKFPAQDTVCSRVFSLPAHFDYERLLAHPEERLQSGKFKTAGDVPEKCVPDLVSYGFVGSYPGVFLSSFFFRDSLEHAQEIMRWFYASRILQGLLVLLPLLRICWIQGTGVATVLSPLPLFVLMIGPLFIQQAFGVSSDAVVLSFSAYLLFFLFYYRSATRKDYAVLLGLGILACETKPNLFPFCSLLVLMGFLHRSSEIAPGDFAPARNRWHWDLAVFGILGVVTGVSIWQFLTTASHTPLYLPGGVNPQLQKLFFKAHPVQGLLILAHAYFSELGFSQFTSKLGWLDTNIAKATANYWRVLLGMAFALEAAALGLQRPTFAMKRIRNAMLVWVLALAAITVSGLATCWVMYMSWTPVGHVKVLGVQPRYFIPHFMLCVGLTWALLNFAFQVKRTARAVGADKQPGVQLLLGRDRAAALVGFVFLSLLVLYLTSFEYDLLMRFF